MTEDQLLAAYGIDPDEWHALSLEAQLTRVYAELLATQRRLVDTFPRVDDDIRRVAIAEVDRRRPVVIP